MILLALPSYRHKIAQNSTLGCIVLAFHAGPSSVVAAGGVSIQSRSAVHLFRTPSLRGQVSPPVDLPAFFSWRCRKAPMGPRRVGRDFAQKQRLHNPTLRNLSQAPCVFVSSSDDKKGLLGCKCRNSWPGWRSAQVSRHAEIRWANRPSSERAQVQAPLPFWTATWLQAQPSVLRATCSSVSRTPAAASHQGLTARSYTTPSHQTARGTSPRRGFLRFEHLKTKDVSCSRRS